MAQSARPEPATVLVVENEAIVRIELADWLAERGLIVLQADGADEAIALLDAHPEVKLLLTDITMPGSMDGARLAHHVRGRWPPVKIIVMSGLIDAHLPELPADSVVVAKPFRHEELWPSIAYLANDNSLTPGSRAASFR